MSKLYYQLGSFASFTNPRSVESDGLTQYVSYGTSLMSASVGTFTMWLKILARGVNAGAAIFSDSGGFIQFNQVGALADAYRFLIFNAQGVRTSPSISIPLNTWVRIAMCYQNDGSRIQIFVNGVEQGAATGSTVSSNISNITNPFRMGGQGVAGLQLNCRINLWQYWNTKFTLADVTQDYDAGTQFNPLLHSKVANLTHSYSPGNGADAHPTINDLILVGSKNGTMTNMSAANFVTDAPPV